MSSKNRHVFQRQSHRTTFSISAGLQANRSQLQDKKKREVTGKKGQYTAWITEKRETVRQNVGMGGGGYVDRIFSN